MLFRSQTESVFGVMESGMQNLAETQTDPSDQETDDQQMSGQPEDLFTLPGDVEKQIGRFAIMESGGKNHFTKSGAIPFNASPQPPFNKNFILLGTAFLENIRKKYRNIIFSDTAKQIERIYAIFRDIHIPARQPGEEINFTPVLLSIHEGFTDHDLKLACYTDHQVFDRYHRYRLRKNFSKSEALTLKEIYGLKPGDFVTHIDHGVGKFAGLF